MAASGPPHYRADASANMNLPLVVEVRQDFAVPERLGELHVRARIRQVVDLAGLVQRLQADPILLVGRRLRDVEQRVLREKRNPFF